jgi:hypothetical protein
MKLRVLICGLLLSISVSVQGATRYVSPAGGNTPPYTSWETAAHVIQVAVDYSSAGDTILVTNGVYNEGGKTVPAVTMATRVFINKDITLKSVNGRDVTTISGNGIMRCLQMNAGHVEGFTLINGVASGGSSYLDSCGGNAFVTGGTVSNCIITQGQAGKGAGVFIKAAAVVADSLITNNMAFWEAGGVFFEFGGSVVRSLIDGNRAGYSPNGAGGGAFLYAGGVLEDCDIIRNSAGNLGGGVRAYASSSGPRGTIRRCIINRNSAAYYGGGVYLEYSMMDNAIVSENSALYGGGGYMAGATVRNSTIVRNNNGLYGTANSDIINSIVWNDFGQGGGANYSGALSFSNSCTYPLAPGIGNIAVNPRLVDPLNGDYYPALGSPCIDSGFASSVPADDVEGTSRPQDGNKDGVFVADMGAYEVLLDIPGVIRFVSLDGNDANSPYRSWATAARTIQAAVDCSADGDLILVAPGLYNEGGKTVPAVTMATRVFINKDITLKSVNGRDVTTISGNGTMRCLQMNAGRVDGFTLMNGVASGGSSYEDSCGGNAFVNYGSISNCIITQGQASKGAGAFLRGSAVVADSLITNNTATWEAGGVFFEHGGAVVRSLIDDNRAGIFPNGAGGGAFMYAGGLLEDCDITRNSAGSLGGGVRAYAESGSGNIGTIRRCMISGNSATYYGGGAHLEFSSMENSIASDNSAMYGGGGFVRGATIRNSTIVRNNNGLYYWQNSTILNSIVWNDFGQGGGVNYTGSGVLTFTNSCTYPLPVNGQGNVAVNPLMVNPLDGDYYLTAGSPCIDSGLSSAAPAVDFEGAPRPLDGNQDGVAIADMGAFEYEP